MTFFVNILPFKNLLVLLNVYLMAACCWLLKRQASILDEWKLILKLPCLAIKYGYVLIHRKVSMIRIFQWKYVWNKTVLMKICILMFSFITLTAESSSKALWTSMRSKSTILKIPARYFNPAVSESWQVFWT